MERARTLSGNNHARRVRAFDQRCLLHPRARSRFNRNKREDCAAFDKPRIAKIFHVTVCRERHLVQASAAALARGELSAARESQEAALGFAHRARSGSSRWKMGKDGGDIAPSSENPPRESTLY